MKIDLYQIPSGGVTLTEEFTPLGLDLDTAIIKFRPPIKVRAELIKISNAVTVRLSIGAVFSTTCSRCLSEFEQKYHKEAQLHYPAGNTESTLILDSEIREEIILDYPINPLCSNNCKGLCPRCGKNLNEGKCDCA